MGEIADMMLEGTMCQGCGVFLHDGEDGPGYPGYCSSCQPPKTAVNYDTPFFPVKNAGTLKEMKNFFEIEGNKFNTIGWAQDKRNNPLARLFKVANAKEAQHNSGQKVAIVVIVNKSMLEEVQLYLKERCGQ